MTAVKKELSSNEIQLFENISNNLISENCDEFCVPMNYVFGEGTLGDIQSFGNSTLKDNSLKVHEALVNTQELEQIWNRSHTQWTWKHLNLHYHAPLNNMRQISAEISAKKAALNEAKWKVVKNEIKIQKIKNKLENSDLDRWKEIELKTKLMYLKESLAEGIKYIEGAMKDILTLNDIFNQIKERIGEFDETDIEKEETISHLKRAIVQCIRDVRQFGSITKGEQEYIEQIGVNPSKLQIILRNYIDLESKIEEFDIRVLHQFVDELAKELCEVHKVDKILMETKGFNCNSNPDFSYKNKISEIKERDIDV